MWFFSFQDQLQGSLGQTFRLNPILPILHQAPTNFPCNEGYAKKTRLMSRNYQILKKLRLFYYSYSESFLTKNSVELRLLKATLFDNTAESF